MSPNRPTSGRTKFVVVAALFASAILFSLVPAFFHAASTHPNVMMIDP
jgi:hypothetical protein